MDEQLGFFLDPTRSLALDCLRARDCRRLFRRWQLDGQGKIHKELSWDMYIALAGNELVNSEKDTSPNFVNLSWQSSFVAASSAGFFLLRNSRVGPKFRRPDVFRSRTSTNCRSACGIPPSPEPAA